MYPIRIVTVEADWLERLVRDYQSTADKLIDAQRQLADKQEDKLLTLQEVCEFTRLSPKTIRLRMGDVLVIADGPKVVRFYRSEVMAWCRRNTIAYAELVEQKPQTGKNTKSR